MRRFYLGHFGAPPLRLPGKKRPSSSLCVSMLRLTILQRRYSAEKQRRDAGGTATVRVGLPTRLRAVRRPPLHSCSAELRGRFERQLKDIVEGRKTKDLVLEEDGGRYLAAFDVAIAKSHVRPCPWDNSTLRPSLCRRSTLGEPAGAPLPLLSARPSSSLRPPRSARRADAHRRDARLLPFAGRRACGDRRRRAWRPRADCWNVRLRRHAAAA